MHELVRAIITVYQACVIGIKEDLLTGTLFALVMAFLLSSPVLLIYTLFKGLQWRSDFDIAANAGQQAVNDTYDALHDEHMSGLRSWTGRGLNLFLAVILLGSAAVLQRGMHFINLLAVAVALPGVLALIVGLRPGVVEAPLRFLGRYLPWIGPSYRPPRPDEDKRH